MNIYSVIFAGGAGTRLWPISRKNSPKQLHHFLDDETMLQKTFNRQVQILGKDNVFISTTANLAPEVEVQNLVSKDHIFIEPIKKDTGPAIGFAALKIQNLDPEAIIAITWSDHYIGNFENYKKLFETAKEVILKDPLAIFMAGVLPRYPETGYGYIEMGEETNLDIKNLHKVASFKEKPNLEIAKEYLKAGNFLWNPAMFFVRADRLMSLYEELAPKHFTELLKIKNSFNSTEENQVIAKSFEVMEKISFDYLIVEKADHKFVTPVDLEWADIGHWKSIFDVMKKENSHAVHGAKYVYLDSYNNLIFSTTKQLISTIGISNTLVIVDNDAILICRDDHAQRVKELVSTLETDPDTAHLT